MPHILLDPRIYSCLSQNSNIKYFNYVNKICLNENRTLHYTALFHYTYAQLFPFIRRRYQENSECPIIYNKSLIRVC